MITPENMDYYITDEYREKVAERLKLLRKMDPRKITQTDVADYLHVERQHINRLENGKIDINMKELIFYSKMFGINIEDLLYADEPEYREEYGYCIFSELISQNEEKDNDFDDRGDRVRDGWI